MKKLFTVLAGISIITMLLVAGCNESESKEKIFNVEEKAIENKEEKASIEVEEIVVAKEIEIKEEVIEEEPVEEELVEIDVNCIDINTATRNSLMTIKHIDEVRVDYLINARPFESVDKLTKINGIGKVRLADIKTEGLACVR